MPRLLPLGLMVLSLSACGRTGPAESGRSSESSAAPAPAATPGSPPPVLPASLAMPLAPPAGLRPVSFEAMQALLPELGGWTRTEATGEDLSRPVAYSRARATYQRDDSRLELEIADSRLNQMLLGPLSIFIGPGYAERSTDGFRRATRIAGMPGMEEWSAGGRHAEVTVLVADRFLVAADGTDIAGLEAVRAAVEQVDLGRLATLR